MQVHDRLSTATTTQSATALALYVHWPFCRKKCPYCDFNSHVREAVDHDAWRAALLRELRAMHMMSAHTQPLTSIFFGGGTPSLMQAQTVADIIALSQKLWGHDAQIEITLEANPTSVEASHFTEFAAAGVNRVSLGIQSLSAESLAFLGREHSADDALRALDIANRYFKRTNFDLIYALPWHTSTLWEKELRKALGYARGHLSLYQLTIEENTAFYHRYHHKKDFALPSPEQAAELYELTQSVMDEVHMPAYEISNHATLGDASRHNLSTWRGDPYIGIGPGAHGRMCTKTQPEVFHATHTLKSPERWLEAVVRDGHGLESITEISPHERAQERLLMQLRLTEGFPLNTLSNVERAALNAQINTRALSMLQSVGLLTTEHNLWCVTPRGRLVLNAIISQLLT